MVKLRGKVVTLAQIIGQKNYIGEKDQIQGWMLGKHYAEKEELWRKRGEITGNMGVNYRVIIEKMGEIRVELYGNGGECEGNYRRN